MRKVLVIEIDVTEGDSWIVAVQKAQLENKSHIEKLIVVKRDPESKIIPVPHDLSDTSFISVIEETHENVIMDQSGHRHHP